MKTKKQIEAWLRIKIKNFQFYIGGTTSYSNIGLKRLQTRLHKIVDQLDEYIKEMELK